MERDPKTGKLKVVGTKKYKLTYEEKKKLHEAAWPKELIEHQRATDDAAQGKRVAGLRVKMGMHSGQVRSTVCTFFTHTHPTVHGETFQHLIAFPFN